MSLFTFLVQRKKRIQDFISQSEFDGVLITDPHNLFYLSGYENQDAFMVITKESSFYITDMRYFTDARDKISHLNIVCLDADFSLSNFCKKNGISKVGFESHHMTLDRLDRLKSKNPSIDFLPIQSPVSESRHIKDKYEICQIKKACDISNEIFSFISKNLEKYETELEVAWEYERLVRERGVSKVSFDPIVANGVGSSIPHHKTSNKKLDLNELTLFDLGCVYNGYCSDMTRVILPQKVDSKVENIFSIVRGAKELAIKMIKPGVNGKEIDLAVREYFKEKGYEENFTHSLGHSVGIDVHDGLALSQNIDLVLKKGMVVTIEPGLYFGNEFGIRDEDIVFVTTNGADILT